MKILTLDQHRELNRAVECYKHSSIPDDSLSYMLVPSVNQRHTRRGDSKKVQVPRVDSELGRKAFSYRGPVFLNGLDENLKNQENRNTFKTASVRYLLHQVNHPA